MSRKPRKQYRAPVGTDPSPDSGVVSEDRAAAMLPPPSLAYNTKAINPTVTQPNRLPLHKQRYPANSTASKLRFPLNQDTFMRAFREIEQGSRG